MLTYKSPTPQLHSVLDKSIPAGLMPFTSFYSTPENTAPRYKLTGSIKRKRTAGFMLIGMGAAMFLTGVGVLIYGIQDDNRRRQTQGIQYQSNGLMLPGLLLMFGSIAFVMPGANLASKYNTANRAPRHAESK